MDTKGISKLDLKRRNRRQILLAIREAGMLARVDIAAKLSLTRAAVTIITNQMIAQNILEDLNGPLPEPDDAPKKKGRKKTMIRINPTYKYVLGAVINENNICVGLSNLANEVLGTCEKSLKDDISFEDIISFIVTSANKLMKKQGLSAKQMLGLGVGIVPSRWEQFRVEREDGVVAFPKLCYMLEIELSMPVAAASSISLYALANIDYGSVDDTNQVLIYSGEHYHSAIINNKSLLGGFSADTTSIDRLIVAPHGEKCEGYPDGSVHAELSWSSVMKRLGKIYGKELEPLEAGALYQQGDERMIELLNGLVDKIAFLIYDYAVAHQSKRVTLQNFEFIPETEQKLREKLAELAGTSQENCPIQLVFSAISGEKSFLAGANLIVEKQFYEMGGLTPAEAKDI